MQDYFLWNGMDCRQYGIHVSEQPPITIPAERSTQTNVPGRPGSLTQLEGEDVYDDLILSATCFISDPAQIPAIAAWLKGSGTVTFANRTGGYYKARIANQIPFEKVLRGNPHCSFAVNFRCFPFWYKDNVSDVTWQRLFRAAHHPDRLRGYYPDGRNHDRGTDRDHIGHRAGLCSERGVSGHRPDERPHVRGFPGAETRPERHQLVRKCDERCHFPEMAFPLMLVSWYSVLGRRHLLKNFFRETIFLPLQQSKLV